MCALFSPEILQAGALKELKGLEMILNSSQWAKHAYSYILTYKPWL